LEKLLTNHDAQNKSGAIYDIVVFLLMLITFTIFVCSQRLIARNVHELFSSNRGSSHFYAACRINKLSRGSILGYEILTTIGFGLP
jgi:hypothetical protein